MYVEMIRGRGCIEGVPWPDEFQLDFKEIGEAGLRRMFVIRSSRWKEDQIKSIDIAICQQKSGRREQKYFMRKKASLKN